MKTLVCLLLCLAQPLTLAAQTGPLLFPCSLFVSPSTVPGGCLPDPPPHPPALLPSTDLSPLLNQAAVNHAAVMGQLADLKTQVAAVKQDVADFRAAVKSVWQQIGEPILKYVVPAIAAYLAGKKL